uniref:Late embryogenesis abundant protein LEA-2 subgroup domain-containing protein n=1 Tax=Aegilops tauschii subsp. strangulata TaxID=200361 RepID=A0A453KV76_AEGTS
MTSSSRRRRGGCGCKESCHGHCLPPHSAKCLCLYLLLALILLILVAAVLLVVFVTRLKKPTFYLQSVQMDRSFSLRPSSSSNRSGENATSSSSCSVASLLFAAQNPNGIGIRYSAADLGVAYANESVGAMDVPVFYQPPRSSNVTVLMHAVFEESNVSRLVVSELSAQRKLVEIRIAGSIDATTHIMNFPLPKFHVCSELQTPYSFHLQKFFCCFTVVYAITLQKFFFFFTEPRQKARCSGFAL